MATLKFYPNYGASVAVQGTSQYNAEENYWWVERLILGQNLCVRAFSFVDPNDVMGKCVSISEVIMHGTVEAYEIASGGGYCDSYFYFGVGLNKYDVQHKVYYEPGTDSYTKSKTINPVTSLPFTPYEVKTEVNFVIDIRAYNWGPLYVSAIKSDIDDYYFEVTFVPAPPTVITEEAEDITNSSARLVGDILDSGGIVDERGFEYYKDGHPDDVTPIGEEGSFGDGEYGLVAGGLESGTKYYFRARAENEAGVDYGSWVSFTTTAVPPTVSTQDVTNISISNAKGHGTIEDTGGEPGVYKCIERGFEVKLEFAGSLGDYVFHSVAGFEGSVDLVFVRNGYGIITDIYWQGTLVKTVKEEGYFNIGEYELWLARTPITVFSDTLFPGETYQCRAYAINEDELKGYGDYVEFTTLEVLAETPGGPPGGGPVPGPFTILKNETIQGLAEGEYATRRGFRYGTNDSANQFDVHEDGFFTNGPFTLMLPDLMPETTYYIVPYIVVNNKTYEGEMEIVETEPEEEEEEEFPEDEFTTPHYGPHGQDYREVETKIFAEVLSVQGIIDYCGGKKTLPINNHLIQEQTNAKTISVNYLDRFQLAKTKMIIEYPTPLPFEKEDTVDFHYGRVPYKADGEGVTLFRADGEGRIKFRGMATMIVRKINMHLDSSGETIEYLANLELEGGQ